MKLKLRVINNPMFMQTLEALAGQRVPSETAYRIKKWTDEIRKAVNILKPEIKLVIDKYAVKDDKGDYIPENGTVKMREGCEMEFKKDFEEILEREIEVNRAPIMLKELHHTNLAPMEIEAIEPILTESNLEIVK